MMAEFHFAASISGSMQAHRHGLLGRLNTTEPLLVLLVIPVLFLLGTSMSSMAKAHLKQTNYVTPTTSRLALWG